MRHVVYISSATQKITAEDLKRILQGARPRNQAHGVTGLLLHHDGSFFQFLEGPADGVEQTLRWVRNAPLHRGMIVMLDEETSEERLFPDWEMASFPVADQPFAEGLEELTAAVRRSQAQLGDTRIGTLLRSFLRGFREFAFTDDATAPAALTRQGRA